MSGNQDRHEAFEGCFGGLAASGRELGVAMPR